MNTTIGKSFRTTRSFPLAGFAGCLAWLFISAQTCKASFTGPDNPGTNYYNIYAYETDSGLTYGHDPEDPNFYNGGPLSSWALLLPQTGLTSAAINANSFMPGTSSSSITANLVSNPTGNGLTITLTNPHTTPDEVRFDWAGTYHHTGAADTIPSYTLTCSGSISGSGYWEVASGETILDQNTSSTYTANISGGTPNLYGPAGSGSWVGNNTSGSFSQPETASFTPVPTISGTDGVLVWGYVDVIVDPGTVTIQIGTPPALGIGTYSNAPVVFYPSNPGNNFTLQMSTNLLSTNWVTVTNGVPFTAVQITNPPNPAFFRLH